MAAHSIRALLFHRKAVHKQGEVVRGGIGNAAAGVE
jgi:hypothetical protein